MAMTEEERRKARNEASKRWYAAHKAAKKTAKAATPKAGAKQKPAKKAEAKPARAAKPAKKAADGDVQKTIDKLVKKNEKIASAAGVLLKEAVLILADVYKTGDHKLIDKTTKLFAKRLSIAVEPNGDGRMVAKFTGAKAFRVPKRAVKDDTVPAPKKEEPADDFEPDSPAEEPKEISVDPSLLTGVEDGTVTKSDLEAQQADEDEDENDPDEDSDPDEDDEEKDPEDMDDEEYARYRERQAEKETDEFFEGRAEAMRELEEQGAFED